MSSLPDLEARLGPEGDGAVGRCIGVESDQDQLVASVEFPLGRAPVLALGRRVELEFRSPDLERSIHTEGRITLRTDGPTRRVFGFRCDLSKRGFLSLLNRRRVRRVRIAPTDGLRVLLLDVSDPPPEATLHDISTIGLSIRLDASLEQRLFERPHLELALALPGDAGSIRVTAVIRHRMLVDGAVQYGLQVVAGIPKFAPDRKRFEAFVEDLSAQASLRAKASRSPKE